MQGRQVSGGHGWGHDSTGPGGVGTGVHFWGSTHGRRCGLSKRGQGRLLRKMRAAGVDENLVQWTDSFMRDRRVIMSVDRQEYEAVSVTTGLPQGSSISPALFALYSTRQIQKYPDTPVTLTHSLALTGVSGDP